MGNELRKPQGPSGFEAVLEKMFEGPSKTLNALDAARRALQQARLQGIDCQRIKVSEQPAHDGQLFDALGEYVPFPKGSRYTRCFVVLLDPSPRTRWGHQAYWAFVPAGGEAEVVIRETELPEAAEGPLRMIGLEMAEVEPS